MALERRRWLREASVAMGVAGLVFVYLGSTSFLERFVNDPFVARARAVVVKTVTPVPTAEVSLPLEPVWLRLSPAGHFLALGTEDDKEQTTIHAGRLGSSLTPFTADEAAFVDERRLLLLERLSGGTSRLRLVDLAGGPDDVWTLSVPVQRARLLFDRASQRWSLLGWNMSGDIATATGVVGEETIGNLGWRGPAAHVMLVSGSSSEVLGLEWKSLPGRFGAGHHPVYLLWSITDRGSAVWTTTRLDLRCGPQSTRGETALCLAFDGTTTRLFEVNPVTRRLKALISIDGWFYRHDDGGNSGWISGWSSAGSVLLRPSAGTAIRIHGRDGSRADELAIGDTVIGAVFLSERGATLRIYDREKIGVR